MNRERVTPFTFVKVHPSPLLRYVGQLLSSASVAMPTGPLAHFVSCADSAGPPTPSVHRTPAQILNQIHTQVSYALEPPRGNEGPTPRFRESRW